MPSMRQVLMVSFMRFRHRSRVDLPQPEGPIRAVICRAGISRVMLFSAWKSP